jgi:hypothetical protein
VPVSRLSFPSALWRRLVAILGAYAIALQLVLSGLLAVSPATWGFGRTDATCLSTGIAATDASSHPADSSPICPHCGFGCAMTGWAAPGDASRMTIWRPALTAVHRLLPKPRVGSRRSAAVPHNPRAPPA